MYEKCALQQKRLTQRNKKKTKHLNTAETCMYHIFTEWLCTTYGHQILPSREDRQQITKIQIRNDDEVANAIRA